MKENIFLLCLILIFIGCGSNRLPDWQYAASSQLEGYKNSRMSGKEGVADLHFNKAVEEIKRSGDLRLLATAYLTKYAVSTALLEDMRSNQYVDVENVEPDSVNRNYFTFLKGNLSAVESNLLSSQYIPFLEASQGRNIESINRAIAGISDPLSRLIAVGITVQAGAYNEATLQMAIDEASRNGWKRALIAYLGKLQSFYEGKNEKEKAEKIRQKLKLII